MTSSLVGSEMCIRDRDEEDDHDAMRRVSSPRSRLGEGEWWAPVGKKGEGPLRRVAAGAGRETRRVRGVR
eukprot:7501066-Prorocentrum_lima.AAC.1